MGRETDALIRRLQSNRPLSDLHRRAIESMPLQVGNLRKGQDVLSEGMCANRCTVLIDGFLHRYRTLADGRRQIFMFQTPGDIPDLHTLQLQPVDHSIAATGECMVGYVPHAAIVEAFAKVEGLIEVFWRATLIDASIFRTWMLNMGRRDSLVQMAHLFCELYARLRAVGRAADKSFHAPLIQEELADAMGISTVHANRVLQQLRRRGLVTFDMQQVHIPDWAALQRFAEFDPDYLHLPPQP